MSWDLDAFRASLVSSDPQFAEAFDTVAAGRLVGPERAEAISALLELVEAGDPRAPRCLAAMQATEAVTDLRVVATAAPPVARAESALALWKLSGDALVAVRLCRAVLGLPEATIEARIRAVMVLEAIGGDDAIDALILALEDGHETVRRSAFGGLLKACGAGHARAPGTRLDALGDLATCAYPGVRAAFRGEVLRMLADARRGEIERWKERASLREGDVEGVGDGTPTSEVDRMVAWGWAVKLAEGGHPKGREIVEGLGVPGW